MLIRKRLLMSRTGCGVNRRIFGLRFTAHAKSSHWHILQAKFVQRVVSSRMPAL
jgi:hypothetical protein